MSPTLADIVSALLPESSVATLISFQGLVTFLAICRQLRDRLLWCQGPLPLLPLMTLPDDIQQFLAVALGVDIEAHPTIISECWTALRGVVWEGWKHTSPASVDEDLLSVFVKHGLALNIGFRDLYPPTRTCLDPMCKSDVHGPQELSSLTSIRSILFSRDAGAIPSWTYSASCRSCGARYYPTYYIHQHDEARSYYGGIPDVIHVTTHVLLERTLCERFAASTVCAWVSATNNARICSLEMSASAQRFPDDWPEAPLLTCETVWDAFFLHALLRDHAERDKVLSLWNNRPQSDRIQAALHEHNRAMVGPGQEHWNHACDLCCAVKTDGAGVITSVIRAVVTDGVTVGRPCCGVADCQGLLPTQRARFCSEHSSRETRCVVVGCETEAEAGYQTCGLSTHRVMERFGVVGRSALFQLKKRLERHRVVYPEDSVGHSEDSTENGQRMALANEEEVEIEGDLGGECEGKSDEGNTRPRARFGRRRTHNEQLCVATCGVILGRATFFGSEAVNGVRMFLRWLFPTLKSLPQVIFFDNNCSLQKLLRSLQDHYFDSCALPVDVFHMKAKHKETDDFCGQNCNPALWPDLMVGDKWRFNSSAAEMTNAWFGGFQAIVREMRAERYDFFLDEMVKLRNRIIVSDLRARGTAPYNIPRSALLADL